MIAITTNSSIRVKAPGRRDQTSDCPEFVFIIRSYEPPELPLAPGAPLTPESVARYPLEHPRCGTAFLLTVVLISIVVFALAGPLPFLWRLLSRLVLIPLIAMLSYEYILFTARYLNNPVVRALVAPNLALQRLTTREPDRPMLEVAIAAFQAMREKESAAPSVA